MEFFSIALLFRYIEVAIDLLNIIVYYACNTSFSATQSQNNFGQFVLIGGLIGAVIVLALSITLEVDKKYPLFVMIYNGIFFIFFLAAGIIILHSWHNFIFPNMNNHDSCGKTVGSFCIFQCLVLIAGAVFIFKQKGSST